MTNRNACGIHLTLVLATLAILAGIQLGLSQGLEWIGAPIEEIRKAAEAGDATAQYELGRKYDRGFGVPEDDEQAVKWYRIAADQGHVGAQLSLGFKYALGEGVWEDDREAVKWFQKAAEQGDADAQAMLGLMYYSGDGVPEDYREAAKWYRKAAEQGHARAQGQLGFMYGRGDGVEKDFTRAYAWANLAAAQGEEVSVTPKVFGLEQMETTLKVWLREQMTSRQIRKAQELAGKIFKRIESSKSR